MSALQQQIEISFDKLSENYDPKKNKTRNILSKYEKAKIIGVRLEQIARGAIPNVPKDKYTNIRDVVAAEFDQHLIPLIVVRRLPDGTKEYWKLEDMVVLRTAAA